MATRDEQDAHPIALTCAVEWLSVPTIQAGAGEQAKGRAKNKPFRMVAYSGGVATIDWYGPCVFDLDTMDLAAGVARLPSLIGHDPDRIVGFVEKRSRLPDEGLVCEGEAFAGMADADKVLEAAERGFPWQASVWLAPGSRERLDPGAKATVNGREVSGPVTIMRNTRLKELTFCSLGGDPNTSAAIAASRGGSMSTPAAQTSPAPASSPTPAPTASASATPAPIPSERAGLGQLLAEAPGHEGLIATLYAKGESDSAIRAACAKKTQELMASKDHELADLRARVAQPGIGFNGAARQEGDPRAMSASAEPAGAHTIKAQAEAVWAKSPKLQAEFGGEFKWFLAECVRDGQVKE